MLARLMMRRHQAGIDLERPAVGAAGRRPAFGGRRRRGPRPTRKNSSAAAGRPRRRPGARRRRSREVDHLGRLGIQPEIEAQLAFARRLQRPQHGAERRAALEFGVRLPDDGQVGEGDEGLAAGAQPRAGSGSTSGGSAGGPRAGGGTSPGWRAAGTTLPQLGRRRHGLDWAGAHARYDVAAAPESQRRVPRAARRVPPAFA